MDSYSDNALMLKVKAGQRDAMGLLFERYHRRLFGYYCQLSQEAELSEDLVQNTFYRMLKYAHTYQGEGEGEGEFITWMFHLARNVWADHYKKQQRLPTEEINQAVPLSIAEETETEGQLTQLRRAIQYLKPERKEVLLLSRYQGLRYQEIAQLLNCSEANVKVRVFRAIQDLRQIFRQLEQQL
ncbi:RNA polymerase sigma factor [Tunicatimonas pelagia]|uniref:RNA polymerase sigma factor n=1 Tax=Tunicatimonas pelagia TaxID=931531 RepID=UPI002666E13A|nr:RNA polymerase sigma factor [Tunicatimonas pelagia]WKN40924.1 RNA polymerase sigma factor [Tunicatimonas pelagia]